MVLHKLLVVFSLLLLSAETCSGAASKDESLIGLTVEQYIIGVFPSYLKEVNRCLNFRLNTTPPLFLKWPEDEFQFCCEDRKTPHTIASYVHSELNGRFLHPIAYYDVGLVDKLVPYYWYSWLPDRISQKDITQVVYCEANDLKRFYSKRFLWEAVGKQGLLYSGIPFIVFVELSVAVAITIQYFRWPLTPVWKTLKKLYVWETFWDLVHLCLLGINGNLLMEASAHWDPCGWEAVVLSNSGVFYTWLTLLSIVSCVVQQIALWIATTTMERLEGDLEVWRHIEDDVRKLKKCKIEKEWQLQRISLQCAVLYVASLYCNFVTVFSRDEFVSWLLGIIIVAQVWTCVVAFGMLYKAYTLGHRCYDVAMKARKFENRAVHAHSSP